METYLDEKGVAELRKEHQSWWDKVSKAVKDTFGDASEWGRETVIDTRVMWIEADKARIKELAARIEKLRPKSE